MTPGLSGQAFNCASGVKVTIQELAEKVLAYFDKKHLPIVYEDWKMGDVKYFDVDNTLLRNTGFDFKYEFEQGLKITLDDVANFLREHNHV